MPTRFGKRSGYLSGRFTLLSNLTVPVLNRYDLLDRMIRSIDYPVKHLLIIDNGRGFSELPENPNVLAVSILDMPSNLGVATSWNLGIKSFAEDDVFFFTSADTQYKPGALETLSHASPERITLATQFPHWHTFAIGSKVVERIGLFDESLYPIYFEDNDYMRRADQAGVIQERLNIVTQHDNSSTINSDAELKKKNSKTFISNKVYYENKKHNEDFSEGRWNISRRRANSWGV